MFKDYDKYLSVSLKVYIFVLVIIFIMKLVGLDYFGLDESNLLINKLNDYLLNNDLKNYVCFIFLMSGPVYGSSSRKIRNFILGFSDIGLKYFMDNEELP